MIPFDLALAELKKVPNPEQRICETSAYWIPLQWVYVRMVENKDLKPWSEYEPRREQWKMVRNENWKRWKKICVCQALYVYKFRNVMSHS